jgi:putative membrane protein
MFHDTVGHGWGMGWVWIIIIISLIITVWVVINSINRKNRPLDTGSKTPLDILKERYARGEINKKEYEERKRDLEA